MSGIISSNGSLPRPMDNLVQDITDFQFIWCVKVAFTTLILHDWILTSHEELTFVWRCGRSLYGRILFVGVRYAALAFVIVYLFPVTSGLENAMAFLRAIVIVCSEAIFATRTWAIWERSRPILVFLIGLMIACVASAITAVTLSYLDALSRLPVILVIEGLNRYQMPLNTGTAGYAKGMTISSFAMLVFQFTVLALALYRLLRYRRDIPKQARSTLVVEVLWVDGVMYFLFMFLLLLVNVGLAFKVAGPLEPLALAQVQTVLHSVISTRVVLHTAKVLRQEIADSRGTVARNRQPSSLRFAQVTIETTTEDVELREMRR